MTERDPIPFGIPPDLEDFEIPPAAFEDPEIPPDPFEDLEIPDPEAR